MQYLISMLDKFPSLLAQAAQGQVKVTETAPSLIPPGGVDLIIATFLVSLLVFTILVGAFLIINLGLMSKRAEDHVGGRSPSDLGILKSNVWPEEPYEERALPAMGDEVAIEQLEEGAEPPPKKVA